MKPHPPVPTLSMAPTPVRFLLKKNFSLLRLVGSLVLVRRVTYTDFSGSAVFSVLCWNTMWKSWAVDSGLLIPFSILISAQHTKDTDFYLFSLQSPFSQVPACACTWGHSLLQVTQSCRKGICWRFLGFLITVLWFISKETVSRYACLTSWGQSRLEKNLVKFASSQGPCSGLRCPGSGLGSGLCCGFLHQLRLTGSSY